MGDRIFFYGRRDHATGVTASLATTVGTTPKYWVMPSASRIYGAKRLQNFILLGVYEELNRRFCKLCAIAVDKNREEFKINCFAFVDATAASRFTRFGSVFVGLIFARVLVQFSLSTWL